jgi:hypothetical protein
VLRTSSRLQTYWDHWLALPSHRPNAVQSGYYETGYAASLRLLLLAMLASYVVRVRYIQRSIVPTNLRTAIDVLLHLYPRLRHRKALTDVYVARHAIVHTICGRSNFLGRLAIYGSSWRCQRPRFRRQEVLGQSKCHHPPDQSSGSLWFRREFIGRMLGRSLRPCGKPFSSWRKRTGTNAMSRIFMVSVRPMTS